MTKKAKNENTAAKTTKVKGAKPKAKGQTKIPGTGRIDADHELEAQAEKVRELQESRMALAEEENEERAKLTDMHKQRGTKEPYRYEDSDGVLRETFLPDVEEPLAKVRKVKQKKAAAE